MELHWIPQLMYRNRAFCVGYNLLLMIIIDKWFWTNYHCYVRGLYWYTYIWLQPYSIKIALLKQWFIHSQYNNYSKGFRFIKNCTGNMDNSLCWVTYLPVCVCACVCVCVCVCVYVYLLPLYIKIIYAPGDSIVSGVLLRNRVLHCIVDDIQHPSNLQ